MEIADSADILLSPHIWKITTLWFQINWKNLKRDKMSYII